MSLGILGQRSMGAVPAPRIDLGPGFPCSEAAEERQTLERGLTAFLDRARNPPGVLAPGRDPLLAQYQEASQQLSPRYRAELTNQAQAIATLRSGALARRGDLQRSMAVHGPYYVLPAPGPFMEDAAWVGVPTRVARRW